MKISYVNGDFVEHHNAKISIDDRGYLFSDGVYEVALINNKKIFAWKEHCERLRYSLNGLQINFEFDNDNIESIVQKLLSENYLSDALVYMQITRGVAQRAPHFPNKNTKASVIITVSERPKIPEKEYEYGASAITTEDLRWKRRNYKTVSLLFNIMAKQAAFEVNAAETILLEDNITVTEGSSSNVFIVKDDVLITHPASNQILNGITRQIIISLAKQHDIKVIEDSFPKDAMMQADEVFITATSKGVLPITDIDGQKISSGDVGKITKKLIKLYNEYYSAA